ncbi:helix-turn-helix domain-containing protein [Paenibacillus endoradicis]|uniref:helix-turn-helix domain-containing protein n=1 Tax=Paenibacillus endoradicis TaxID=2972487 RepID=UPI002158A24D|nr:helix-turn-helix domain-containing protein [Paenibacillus endoradicis]MCR8656864.1 AraC family transcriptional regulator [Paenibacillus endoradicis]
MPVYLLCFITEGEEIVVIDGTLKKIRPFQLYMLTPGMIVEFPDIGIAIEYYAITFEPLMLVKAKGKYEAQSSLSDILPSGHIPVHHPQQIFQQILHLYHHSKQGSSMDSSALRIQFEQLLHDIMLNESKQTATVRDERVERSIFYMEQHYKEKVSIEQLAEAAGSMSLAAFSNLFRQKTGQPPVEYLSNLRMNLAKQKLNKKNSLVKEVAADVGFRSEFYFSRMFQRTVGVSPTLFMKRGKLKVAIASSLGFGDHLKSLGIEPICEVNLFHYPGHSHEQYIERLNSQFLELERSKPDLIIADHYHTEFKDRFKRMAAPVFMDFSVWDWKRNFERIAELVNREREASEMLTRLDVQIETAGRTLRGILGEERITILQVSHRSVGIQGRERHPLNELVFGELALHPGAQASGELWRQEMQPEIIPVLETEHLLIHHHHALAGSEQVYERLVKTNAWPQIKAVRDGNVMRIPNWFVMSWTPLGRQRIIEELLTAFKKQNKRSHL